MTGGARSRLSDFPPRSALGTGLHPSELWGVATKDPYKHKQGTITRSAQVRERLALRKLAKQRRVPFKQILREVAAL